MDGLLNIITSTFKSIHINERDIENVDGFVNERMKLFGWSMIEMYKDIGITIKFNDKQEIEEGYLLNKDEVLEMNGKDEIITIIETIDKENGVRFEGGVFDGIPFGFGLLFDENGNKMYEGMMINWHRMGYGNSFNENGFKEYEGYWCNDMRCGCGKSFDIEGSIIYEGNWIEGVREDQYEGDGSNLNIKVKHMKLVDNCILKCFDVSLFILLEELIIGNECFENVDTFRIDGLNHLKSIKIGINSFTKKKNSHGNNKSRSFHVLNCAKLESIEIGQYSFSDYSGEFELKNLSSLSSIEIGETQSTSCNFINSSFVVKDLPNLHSIQLGMRAFQYSLSTVISNLPNLKSIQLGYLALSGKGDDSSCCLEMKDLPKLEEITSNGRSFRYPQAIILYNIPNLKRVAFLWSFQYAIYSTIENVHHIFASKVPTNLHFYFIQSIDSAVTSIHLPDWTCNDLDYTTFDFSRFSLLEDLIIGDDSFYSVDSFRIDGFNHLQYIKIGKKSFTKGKYSHGSNPARSFHVLNCDRLESIEIGECSFSDYSGQFELKNLPSLSSIKIGEIGSESQNFYFSSFVVKDLPNLQSIELGACAFCESLSAVISNLPNLKSIQLGYAALEGSYDDSCCLEMKDLPKLTEIINHDRTGGSFKYPRSLILSNIPNLKTVHLPHSFQKVPTKSISDDVSSFLSDLIVVEESDSGSGYESDW